MNMFIKYNNIFGSITLCIQKQCNICSKSVVNFDTRMALICKVVTRVLQKGPSIHTTSACGMWANTDGGPRKWLEYNNKMYPPQGPEEEPRPAVSLYCKKYVRRYSIFNPCLNNLCS